MKATRAFAIAAALLAIAPAARTQQWSTWKDRYRQVEPASQIEYRLPFDAAAQVRVDQGPRGRYSHDDAANRDAIDFALPIGTPVLAAREGVVVAAAADSTTSGARRQAFEPLANFVRIRHVDGSVATYAHLKTASVNVRVGQRVRAGERIGLSGNTGFSTAPHLHFVVQVDRGRGPESIPVRVVGPLGELRFPRADSSHDDSSP